MSESVNFYGEIPYVGKPVSRIFFGIAIPPLLAGEEQDRLLDEVVDAGINAFDMAQNYQKAEKTIGNWLKKRGCRDNLVLLSKCGHPYPDGSKRISEKEIRKDFMAQTSCLLSPRIGINH